MVGCGVRLDVDGGPSWRLIELLQRNDCGEGFLVPSVVTWRPIGGGALVAGAPALCPGVVEWVLIRSGCLYPDASGGEASHDATGVEGICRGGMIFATIYVMHSP